ncbi:MAG: hypothetical protein WDM87_11330 [Terracidiphilus sp.]
MLVIGAASPGRQFAIEDVVESGGGHRTKHVARGERRGEAEDYGAGIFALEAIDAEG